MADYLTTDTELTSVANAIRTRGGTSGSLVYPDGFVTAIQNIPSGGSLPSANGVKFGTSFIEFSLYGNSYTAEDGMTWAQFVNSTYNPGDFGITGSYVMWWGVNVGDSNHVAVTPSDTIISGEDYTTL